MPFFMIRNDITKVHADAIVNPANEDLLEGSGTSRAIYLAAGEYELADACLKIGHCNLGQAVATPAFQLSAKYIFHAVGPVWLDGKHGEEKLLYDTYRNSLMLAADYHLESIAFPLLSSGNYGYPKDKALNTAIRAVSDFLMEQDMLVYLVLYDRTSLSVSQKLFSSIEEYIDDHYVDENDESIWGDEDYPEFAKREFEEKFKAIDFSDYKTAEEPVCKEVSEVLSDERSFCENTQSAPIRSLENLLNHQTETFSQMLLRLIDERGLKDSYVYKKANIDRRHFSKIRNNMDYAPNKKTVLALAIALELSLDETKDLLMRAGFAFSCCSKSDVIICYFIENRKYDIFEINELLFVYGEPILGE